MKLLFILSLLCINNPVTPPDSSKQKAPKKQVTAPPKPIQKPRQNGIVFPSVLIVDLF